MIVKYTFVSHFFIFVYLYTYNPVLTVSVFMLLVAVMYICITSSRPELCVSSLPLVRVPCLYLTLHSTPLCITMVGAHVVTCCAISSSSGSCSPSAVLPVGVWPCLVQSDHSAAMLLCVSDLLGPLWFDPVSHCWPCPISPFSLAFICSCHGDAAQRRVGSGRPGSEAGSCNTASSWLLPP